MEKGIKLTLMSLTIMCFIIGVVFAVRDIIKIRNPYDNPNFKADSIIDLTGYMSNLILTNGGEYTLTGSLKGYSIILRSASEPITLNLKNLKVTSNTGAIINEGVGKLTIKTMEDTNNNLTDTSANAIHSTGDLTIDGTGTLRITASSGKAISSKGNIIINNGNLYISSYETSINSTNSITMNQGKVFIDSQMNGISSDKQTTINNGTLYITSNEETGKAFDTRNGYLLNGGLIIGLGNGNIECPVDYSKQKTLCLTFDKQIDKKKIIALTTTDYQLILGLRPDKKTKTLVISSDKIIDGEYVVCNSGSLNGEMSEGIYYSGTYVPGNKIFAGNLNSFVVDKIVNKY